MVWYLGIVFGYSLIGGLILRGSHPSGVGLALLAAGFFAANFLGAGLGMRQRGDSFASGIKNGLLLGGYWLAMMAGTMLLALIGAAMLSG